MSFGWLIAAALWALGACAATPAPKAKSFERKGPLVPPPKPGESITKTMMCTCTSCEPSACCRDLEKDAPAIDAGCAQGYDFSKCQTPVQSCEGRCYQQRWRARVEIGCESARPKNCCHATADF